MQMGNNINGEQGDNSGSSVSLSSTGNIVAIGSPNNDENGQDSGVVRVYQYQGSSRTWTQLGDDIQGESSSDYSGIVSLNSDGNIVAIGATHNDNNGVEDVGHVRIYEFPSEFIPTPTPTPTPFEESIIYEYQPNTEYSINVRFGTGGGSIDWDVDGGGDIITYPPGVNSPFRAGS